MQDVRRFEVPAVIHGGGCRGQLPAVARELGAKRVLIVTDAGMVKLGVAAEMVGLLEREQFAVAVFDAVQPDPTDVNVAEGVAALVGHRADVIVALGGGSPIDAAKVIAVRGANPGPLVEYMGMHKIGRAGVPLVVIPTTAGTGSEASKVAVITDTVRQVKMMMLSVPLMPRVALVDFELTLTMPAELTAAVGVDTLTHGIEAYVSRKGNLLSDPLALQCVALVAKHLPVAWREPSNREARAGMMLAATLGGMAFSNSSVCLVHGMSRPIGALFHIAHGLSNAVLLPTVTRYSVGAAEGRYAAVARAAGCAGAGDSDAGSAASLIPWLEDLNATLKLPRLSGCRGVTRELFEESVEKMARDAIMSGSPGNNPRVPEVGEIVELYREAW